MRDILIKMKGVLKIESEKRKVVISEDQMMLHDFPFGQKICFLVGNMLYMGKGSPERSGQISYFII